MKKRYEAEGVAFYASIAAMPDARGPVRADRGPTADNPKFFADLVAKTSSVYLGQRAVGRRARGDERLADARGVKVFLGYNKNVTDYVTQARDFEAKTAGATYVHPQ